MALTDTSKIGLANRFHAVANGVTDLGSWFKVDGLDVTWDVADFRVGDQGNHRWYFPANNKYSTVKMQRAATSQDSPKVREWLNKTSFGFEVGGIVTLTLADSALTTVMEWELRNVMPSKWSINTFDANGSAVAIETLELVHEGFLDDQRKF